MDMLKYLPGFKRDHQKETGEPLSAGFYAIVENLQEIGNVFTDQGRADAAAGEYPRFADVFLMATTVEPEEGGSFSRLMRLCYEEGYNEPV